MKPLNSLKTVITLVPLAVLCILYGLWLVLEPPVYLESVLYGTLVLGLFCALYIRFIPACAAQLEQRSRSEEDPLPFRTHSAGGRELLRLLVILIAARAMLFILVYLLHLQLNGFTGTFLMCSASGLTTRIPPDTFPLSTKAILPKQTVYI